MAWWSRRSHVPAEVLGELDLVSGERVLASASATDGAYVIATDLGLWLPEGRAHRRISWESIDRAMWHRETAQLTVVESTPLGRPSLRHTIHLADPGRLVDVVRDLVNATVVISRHVPLHGEHGVRVVGRRRPGGDRVAWTVSVDQGIDVTDPQTQNLIDSAVAEVRAEVGE